MLSCFGVKKKLSRQAWQEIKKQNKSIKTFGGYVSLKPDSSFRAFNFQNYASNFSEERPLIF